MSKLNISIGEIGKMDSSDKEALKRTRVSNAEYVNIAKMLSETKVKEPKLEIIGTFEKSQFRNLATSINGKLKEFSTRIRVKPVEIAGSEGKTH